MNIGPSILFFSFAFILLVALLMFLYKTNKKQTEIKWLEITKKEVKKAQRVNQIKFLQEAEKLGKTYTAAQYFMIWSSAIMVSFIFALIFKNPLISLVGIGGFWFVQKIYLSQLERKEREKARDELGPVLQNLASSYRTHKNWLLALESVVPTIEEPLKEEFQRAKDDHQSGTPIGEVFRNLKERLKDPELQLFVTMAEISQEVGEEASKGVMIAGNYYLSLRLTRADIRNAMLEALNENKWILIVFIAIIVGFRFYQPQFFQGFTDTLLGQILLFIYLSIAVAAVIRSYMVSRKEL
ncbi:MAG TPA: hypothetical protein GXX18_06265 [Bacillales bacterium]|nr:hypothetical protein [Bacillales bacterium]